MDYRLTDFLPTTKREIELRGWNDVDVVLFSGDAYVDHPSFGAAVIGRVLEAEGLRVAIVPQPDWHGDFRDFTKFGRPRMFFAISAGAMDSMVNHYTANRRLRSNDAYSPDGRAGLRPDNCTIVYANILKRLYPDVPLVVGGIYSEFAKIVCISVGFMHYDNGRRLMRTKSFAGDDEAQLLRDFSDMASRFLRTREHRICGHNIKEFDVPFICRRMLVNGLPLPSILDVAGRKPWETPFIDTMELWKFGDFKSFTSLKLLCAIFGIPTPKDDIDGSEVAAVYYDTHDVHRIAVYCEKDVVATAQVFLRMNGIGQLAPDDITHVN